MRTLYGIITATIRDTRPVTALKMRVLLHEFKVWPLAKDLAKSKSLMYPTKEEVYFTHFTTVSDSLG